jgi:endo-1,4-beta-xylanase
MIHYSPMRILVALLLLVAPGAPAQTLRELGAQRKVRMGAAVDTADIANDAAYAALLAQQYDMIEAENEMKWAAVEPAEGVFRFAAGNTLASFAQAHGMKLRGHNLCWHSYNPRWLAKGAFTPSQLSKLLETYITTVAGHFKGKVFAWDVVNEAVADNGGGLRDSIWYNKPGIGVTGPGYIDQAFRWAHAADPDAVLFYNDYDVEDPTNNPKSDAMYSLVKGMLARGVPIGGVGLQLHIAAGGKFSAAGLDANIARLIALGLQVQFTELDVRIPVDASGNASAGDLAAQAQRYRDVVAVCIKYPACTAIQTWGFTDKHSWIPQFYKGYGAALPFDKNYQPKPAYASMLRALAGTTGSTGN